MNPNSSLPPSPAQPSLHPSVYLAAGVQLIGDVTIGEESSVWYNAVIRGDDERILIGRQCNVQDLCVLHVDHGLPCTLGDRVSLGHGAIVHGAIVEDDVLIGMRAVVMNGARIGTGCIIGVGAVVTERTVIPPHSVVLGIPGRIVRQAGPRDAHRIRHAADHYVAAVRRLRASCTGSGVVFG
jgi:carbonic anhydrase/acetyltransferase-like protein (isoleucine patch superfamily)